MIGTHINIPNETKIKIKNTKKFANEHQKHMSKIRIVENTEQYFFLPLRGST